jgi:hypothetical protein
MVSGHGIAPTIPQLRQAEVTPLERYGTGSDCSWGVVLMFCKIACRAALVVGVLFIPSLSAYACEGEDCPALVKTKPLNIMQFMREQAASTRVAKPRRSPPLHTAAKVNGRVHAAAKSESAVHRPVAARPKPAPLPTEAAASFASQGQPAVFPAASPPLPETVGAAPTTEPDVQLVAAEEFNEIDGKADDNASLPAPLAVVAPAAADVPVAPKVEQVSWLQWLWSALTGTFAALATAMRQLTGL